jgi:hypothetical protein
MDKRLQFTGGEGDVRLDQILFGADANALAIQSMLQSFSVGTNPNFIIDGCVVTVGGASPTNTWSMTAGYIYLNDEILEVETDSGTFDSATQYLAFAKTTTYRADGDKTFIDGNPRQTLQQNRGTITAQGSVAVTELDAISGETMRNKIHRYVAGGRETADTTNLTIANDTQYVNYTMNGPVTRTITIPDADDVNVFNEFIMINVTWVQGTLSIEQADSTSIVSGFSTNAFIILQNDGSTWNVVLNLKSATDTEAVAGTNDSAYLTPANLAAVTGNLKTNIINIGDWNMDTTASITVAHSLTHTDIRGISAIIRDDTDTNRVKLTSVGAAGSEAGGISVDASNFNLSRITGGEFDSASYDSTSYNRGYIIVWYI